MINTKLVLTSLLAVTVLSITSASGAFATNSPTHGSEAGNTFDNSDGFWWGFFTQEGATEDGQATGQHASDPNGSGSSSGGFVSDPGRDGLGNLSQFTGGWCDLLLFLGFGCA